MKEYTYEIQHSWERQRRPITTDNQHYRNHHHHHHHHHNHNQHHYRHERSFGKEDAAVEADASSISETTSESGVSDLETSMTDIRCTCCPYGYHLDTDFVKFLDDMYGSDVLRTLKKIERKRHDVRSRLINEQQPIQSIPVSSSVRNSSSYDSDIIRETILELDRIVEKDIKDLESQCHRHATSKTRPISMDNVHQQRSRSVDSRRHIRPPPRPPTSSSMSSASRTAEERRLCEQRIETEKIITTRTHSVPRLNQIEDERMNSLKKLNITSSAGPITMLYKIPPPPFSPSTSSSSLSTETTLRVSSPEPEDRPREPLKPLYITEIIVPPKPVVRPPEPIKTTVITVTDKGEIERRNREIERLELERKTLLSEKELLLKEIDRYKHQKLPEKKTTSITIRTNQEQIQTQQKPSTREVAMQHIVEEDQPPPLPPKIRQQRDVAINHRTEYDEDEEQQVEIVRRKLEEIQNFYNERIHFLEDKIVEQEKEIVRLTEPKSQRHVNTQCQPSMQDRALVTDTFVSVRDVALTCNLQPTLPAPIAHRDVNLQCNTDEFIQKRDVWMEALPDIPMKRDVAIGVSINVTPDKHYRDVGTHVNFDYKPEICQRDVATMFAPEPIEKYDRASNTTVIHTRDFSGFANTIEPPKPPPKPSTRQAATDTYSLVSYRDTASGPYETIYNRDVSTDTSSLISLNDRGSGIDLPPELLSRTVSTDTRTLISIRDNFSLTTPTTHILHIDAQTQSIPPVQHDASSNTFTPPEQRHTGVQAVQEQPIIKNQTTSVDIGIFHQLGHLRHNISNTDLKRSTDRSIGTEQQKLSDLAVNTEPKIMYSKDSGDYDVRGDSYDEKYEELTWQSLHGQPRTMECGLQTDLFDTKRIVGYLDQELKVDDEDMIEEQRQEIITFRLPLEQRTTEEIYETTIVTEMKQNNQTEEITRTSNVENSNGKTSQNKTTDWIKTSEKNEDDRARSKSPEELVEESYEVVSTLAKPRDGSFLITGTGPRSTVLQKYDDISPSKFQTSEDDSSYCEEWTVTEAKRKQDGETVQMTIERGGHHRYSVDSDNASALLNQPQHHVGIGTQIHRREETRQLSPSTTYKTTIFESRRKLGSNSPPSSLRTYKPTISSRSSYDASTDEQHVEENYEVTLSSTYDESGLRVFTSKPLAMSPDTNDEFQIDEELYIACAIIDESLFDVNADKKKLNNCLQLIQQEWFRISSQQEINIRLIEKFLNSIKESFSNFLLERIVNLQDSKGNTALHYCVTHGHWYAVNILLDTKVCDVCLQNHAGYTAVMMAAVIDITNDDQRQTVRRLFNECGNINVRIKDSNQTALMLAVKHGKTELVELLLNNGASVNLQDSEGATALIYAVERGLLNIVKLLLSRPECDVEIVDNNGQTALSIAAQKNRKNILVELYAKIKEQKGYSSAFSNQSRITNRSSMSNRSVETSPNQTMTTEMMSSSFQGSSTDEMSPKVSTNRRYYTKK